MEKEIKAVLFDMDGTLTDTEKLYQTAWPQTLEHFGYEMSEEKPLILRSLGRPFAVQQFKEWYGEDFDYWKVRNYRKQLVEEMLAENGIPLKPGAKEILQWLREQRIFTALVTANDKDRAERYTKRVGLYEYFDAIICADMVEFGKPAPDIYAYACRELNLPPEQTIAVEDSPNGCRSAHGAGCNVVMIPDLTEPDEELSKILYKRLDTLMDLKNLFK
ncbi:HAD family phosphatase [Pseudobutyrivibrio xylanivorans]|uniref:HAD family phosphatase n=2 Tax=Pseudobutyrivibrio xylanivorans TaxID=185007 RepID=A0A5P6VW31_PSEXY|nr:HAD family phosphatase [Pseudobutyrivibrio xylanivorans]